ncbi:hypothetical protein F511_13877 [Dorcoceras hygrometricum]|uniref:Uncharacterized protein n=1 Tax=Dorcoceras hygrometricum TaxID=472368 RepID=A0A2Z7B781_9LAMI|nr:hypothetical protein F511_13877 [Dorcoceras hygrometricum]
MMMNSREVWNAETLKISELCEKSSQMVIRENNQMRRQEQLEQLVELRRQEKSGSTEKKNLDPAIKRRRYQMSSSCEKKTISAGTQSLYQLERRKD